MPLYFSFVQFETLKKTNVNLYHKVWKKEVLLIFLCILKHFRTLSQNKQRRVFRIFVVSFCFQNSFLQVFDKFHVGTYKYSQPVTLIIAALWALNIDACNTISLFVVSHVH